MTAAGNNSVDKRWEDYKKSGRWKCKKSPTGAHHWRIDDSTQQCIYCKVKKPVPTEVSAAELKKLMKFTRPIPKSWARNK